MRYERHYNIYVHTILTLLKREGRVMGYREIEAETGINIVKIPGLLEMLLKNAKIQQERGGLLFLPTYVIKSEEDLLEIVKSTYSVSYEEVIDSLVDGKEVVDRLLEKRDIFMIRDLDGSAVLFYNCMKVKKASSDVVKLYEEVVVPDQRKIEKELTVAGLKMSSTQDRSVRKAIVAKGKKKRYSRKIKITNTHLDELLPMG